MRRTPVMKKHMNKKQKIYMSRRLKTPNREKKNSEEYRNWKGNKRE